jgi:hypothetical protein
MQRESVKIWYPKADDLALPDVPSHARSEVRKILGFLGKFPVRSGTCWQTAKAVTLLSRDPRVEYVEGVSWNVEQIGGRYVPMFRHEGECSSDVCVCKPLPHAWNLVNGHVVDLLAEFSNWRFGSEYLHEPLKVYSAEDLVGGVPGNFSITQKAWMKQHQDREPESMAAICQHVFKEAKEKLEMSIEKESGEWLDKEPRKDGKPRRWKPAEIITIDPSRLISLAQEDTLLHRSENTHPHDRMST